MKLAANKQMRIESNSPERSIFDLEQEATQAHACFRQTWDRLNSIPRSEWSDPRYASQFALLTKESGTWLGACNEALSREPADWSELCSYVRIVMIRNAEMSPNEGAEAKQFIKQMNRAMSKAKALAKTFTAVEAGALRRLIL